MIRRMYGTDTRNRTPIKGLEHPCLFPLDDIGMLFIQEPQRATLSCRGWLGDPTSHHAAPVSMLNVSSFTPYSGVIW